VGERLQQCVTGVQSVSTSLHFLMGCHINPAESIPSMFCKAKAYPSRKADTSRA
jgi:hypothetical protein